MPIQSGRLRHRVKIQSPSETQNPVTGEVVLGWADVATVWAEVAPLSAREFVAAQSIQSEISTRITIRHRDGLSPDMRILHKGKVYNPHGFLSDADSGLEYITIPCSEGVSVSGQ